MAGVAPIGLECKLYYSLAYTTPTQILINNAIDVSMPSITKTKVALPSRRSVWNGKRGGMREMTLDFGYRYERGTDTVLAALRDSFLNDTVLYFWVMDNLIATSGAQGFMMPGIVFDFPIDQALEAGQQINIGAEFALIYETASSSYINPAWFTVT